MDTASDMDADTYAHTDAYSHADRYYNTYAHGDTDRDANADENIDGDSYAWVNTDKCGYSNGNVNPHLKEKRRTLMKRHTLLIGLTLLLATRAYAGQWQHTFFAKDFDLGDATRATDSGGNTVLHFPTTPSRFATAEYTIPSFLLDGLITCQIFASSDSNGGTENIKFDVSSRTTTALSKWEDNTGVGTYVTVTFNPSTTLRAIVDGTTTALTSYNQYAAATCASIGACAGFPSRLRIVRDVGVGSNDPETVTFVKALCYATTN